MVVEHGGKEERFERRETKRIKRGND